jgi:alkyl-hydroperoxide reductase/thiol specific antioxidant family protein
LRRHAGEFARLNTEVLIISFGVERWARAWLRETEVPFPLLLDQDRRVYRAYGLERSALRAWAPRVIWYYVRHLAGGRRLHPIEGDPHQLGGDFIIDRHGIVRLGHRERDPVDRPPVAGLLEVLRGLETGEQRGAPSGL